MSKDFSNSNQNTNEGKNTEEKISSVSFVAYLNEFFSFHRIQFVLIDSILSSVDGMGFGLPMAFLFFFVGHISRCNKNVLMGLSPIMYETLFILTHLMRRSSWELYLSKAVGGSGVETSISFSSGGTGSNTNTGGFFNSIGNSIFPNTSTSANGNSGVGSNNGPIGGSPFGSEGIDYNTPLFLTVPASVAQEGSSKSQKRSSAFLNVLPTPINNLLSSRIPSKINMHFCAFYSPMAFFVESSIYFLVAFLFLDLAVVQRCVVGLYLCLVFVWSYVSKSKLSFAGCVLLTGTCFLYPQAVTLSDPFLKVLNQKTLGKQLFTCFSFSSTLTLLLTETHCLGSLRASFAECILSTIPNLLFAADRGSALSKAKRGSTVEADQTTVKTLLRLILQHTGEFIRRYLSFISFHFFATIACWYIGTMLTYGLRLPAFQIILGISVMFTIGEHLYLSLMSSNIEFFFEILACSALWVFCCIGCNFLVSSNSVLFLFGSSCVNGIFVYNAAVENKRMVSFLNINVYLFLFVAMNVYELLADVCSSAPDHSDMSSKFARRVGFLNLRFFTSRFFMCLSCSYNLLALSVNAVENIRLLSKDKSLKEKTFTRGGVSKVRHTSTGTSSSVSLPAAKVVAKQSSSLSTNASKRSSKTKQSPRETDEQKTKFATDYEWPSGEKDDTESEQINPEVSDMHFGKSTSSTSSEIDRNTKEMYGIGETQSDEGSREFQSEDQLNGDTSKDITETNHEEITDVTVKEKLKEEEEKEEAEVARVNHEEEENRRVQEETERQRALKQKEKEEERLRLEKAKEELRAEKERGKERERRERELEREKQRQERENARLEREKEQERKIQERKLEKEREKLAREKEAQRKLEEEKQRARERQEELERQKEAEKQREQEKIRIEKQRKEEQEREKALAREKEKERERKEKERKDKERKERERKEKEKEKKDEKEPPTQNKVAFELPKPRSAHAIAKAKEDAKKVFDVPKPRSVQDQPPSSESFSDSLPMDTRPAAIYEDDDSDDESSIQIDVSFLLNALEEETLKEDDLVVLTTEQIKDIPVFPTRMDELPEETKRLVESLQINAANDERLPFSTAVHGRVPPQEENQNTKLRYTEGHQTVPAGPTSIDNMNVYGRGGGDAKTARSSSAGQNIDERSSANSQQSAPQRRASQPTVSNDDIHPSNNGKPADNRIYAYPSNQNHVPNNEQPVVYVANPGNNSNPAMQMPQAVHPHQLAPQQPQPQQRLSAYPTTQAPMLVPSNMLVPGGPPGTPHVVMYQQRPMMVVTLPDGRCALCPVMLQQQPVPQANYAYAYHQ